MSFAPLGATGVTAGAENDEAMLVERDVAVLFVDIVGCSRLCEDLPPLEMNALIEDHFGSYFDVVQSRRGIVNEIMGDGFMALFGSGSLDVNAEDALSSASEILRLTARASAGSELATRVHVGLHAGPALVGVSRFRTRLGERWTYTASGPVTNIAARLCQLAGPDAVVVSSAVVDLIGDRFRFQDLGDAVLKNIRRPVGIHRLVDEWNGSSVRVGLAKSPT